MEQELARELNELFWVVVALYAVYYLGSIREQLEKLNKMEERNNEKSI